MLGVYLAHMIVRQIDFSIRHDGAAAVNQWLTYARDLVPAWRPRTSEDDGHGPEGQTLIRLPQGRANCVRPTGRWYTGAVRSLP